MAGGPTTGLELSNDGFERHGGLRESNVGSVVEV